MFELAAPRWVDAQLELPEHGTIWHSGKANLNLTLSPQSVRVIRNRKRRHPTRPWGLTRPFRSALTSFPQTRSITPEINPIAYFFLG